MTSPYTKTHEVMLEKEIKKLRKEVRERLEELQNIIILMSHAIEELQDATTNRKITKDRK